MTLNSVLTSINCFACLMISLKLISFDFSQRPKLHDRLYYYFFALCTTSIALRILIGVTTQIDPIEVLFNIVVSIYIWRVRGDLRS